MKKVIDGKVYNTETAELVHEWTNGRSTRDFKHRSKDLYKTKKGNWFIYHMAVSCGDNSYSGSKDIEPISEKNALRFLESHDGIKAIEKYFADQIEEA